MIYAVGDIHGMRGQLEELIDRLPLEPDDHLIFIGDYVDRGRDPAGTVEYLTQLQQRQHCTFLIGNHEGMFLSFLGWEGPAYFGGEAFIQNGGETTLQSYSYFEHGGDFRLPPHHEKFFHGLKLWHLEEDYIFVHAGLSKEAMRLSDPEVALEAEDPRDLLWQRATIDIPHSLGATIIYGHTPMPDLQVRWNLPFSIGIDTGCVYGGALTAIQLPGETLFQV